jgi:hypothetical protein
MDSGATLLAAMTMLLVFQTLFALYFRYLIDRVESGEKVWLTFNPADARRMINTIHIVMPLVWVMVALVSFGVIPVDGIEPIRLR